MAAKHNWSATRVGELRKREEGFFVSVLVVIDVLVNELLLKVIGSSHTGN
jgi:hypothetical protein